MSTQTLPSLRRVLITVSIAWAALLGNVLLATVASAGFAENASWQGQAAARTPHKPEAALPGGPEAVAQDGALRIQMAMILDGSGSINPDEWAIIINGLAAAVEDPQCVPQDGSMQLAVVQFGWRQARLQVAPVAIDSSATAADAARQIRGIRQIGFGTPMATGICLAANVLRYHPDSQFDPGLRQVVNLISDGVPNECGPCDACPVQGPAWRCESILVCPGDCSAESCPPAEDSAVVARNHAISLLEMDPGQDEFDAEGVGITESNKEWLRTGIAWPGNYEWVPPDPPPGRGWVRVVADAQEFTDTICGKFRLAAAVMDFGDAPDSNDPTVPSGYNYPTLEVSNGARHLIGDIGMGAFIDAEPDGQPIDQDDVLPPGAPDDEDGVVFLGAGPPGGPYALPYTAGQNGAVQITISSTNGTGGTGFLHGWFDWNQDGDWNDPHENVFSGYAVPLGPGVFHIDFPVPSDALPAPPGVTWARFRLDDQNLQAVDGLANNGEVEDYNEAVVCPQMVVEVAAEPASGCAPLTVQFEPSVSGGTPPYAYLWDLDGSRSTLANPVHTYDAGTYTVTLTVTDSYGCSTTHSEPGYITVYALPTARFAADPSSGFVPLTVQFSDLSIPADAPIAQWYWDFGDGGASTQQNPSYTYREPGVYTVTLTVTDQFGCSDTVSQPNQILAGEIQISKHRPHGVICATHLFWYYICVTNTSEVPMPAINPVITDVLPDGIAPYSVLVSEPGVFDGIDTVTWNLDTLAPGDHTCVWIRAQTHSRAAGTRITNRAWIDADNLPQPILATDEAYVYRPPCPPQSTVTPLPTATSMPTYTPTALPTAAQTAAQTATQTPTVTRTPATGGIIACLWNDLDGDGFQGVDEPGLGGIPIAVRDIQGQSVDACSTETSGCCTVTNLPPGTYTVTAGAVQGLILTTPPTAQVEVFAGQLSEVFFGSRQLSRLLLPVIVKN